MVHNVQKDLVHKFRLILATDVAPEEAFLKLGIVLRTDPGGERRDDGGPVGL